jgi:hypothetical protein
MPASSPGSPARPPARRGPPPAGLFAAADAAVVALHGHGFLQSLCLHAAGLLLMALLVIEPPAPSPAARLHLAFTPADSAAVDMAAVDLPADEAPALAGGAASPTPEPAAAGADPPAAVAAVEPVMLDPLEPAAPLPVADADLAAVVAVPIAAMPVSAQPNPWPAGRFAGRGRGPGPGTGSGQGGGIGGEIGRRLRAAGARTGDVQVSIAWNNVNDIDVHVLVESPAFVPGVSLVNYTNRRGVCGGWLDVDENVLPRTPLAVENVFWARGAAPPGRYTVAVHHYRNWGGPDPTPVEIVVLLDGWQKRFEAVVHAGRRPVVVTSFVRRPGDASWLADDGWIPATGP